MKNILKKTKKKFRKRWLKECQIYVFEKFTSYYWVFLLQKKNKISWRSEWGREGGRERERERERESIYHSKGVLNSLFGFYTTIIRTVSRRSQHRLNSNAKCTIANSGRVDGAGKDSSISTWVLMELCIQTNRQNSPH